MLPKLFQRDRFIICGLIGIIEFNINHDEGIIISDFVLKIEFFTADTPVCAFNLDKIKGIVQKYLE